MASSTLLLIVELFVSNDDKASWSNVSAEIYMLGVTPPPPPFINQVNTYRVPGKYVHTYVYC